MAFMDMFKSKPATTPIPGTSQVTENDKPITPAQVDAANNAKTTGMANVIKQRNELIQEETANKPAPMSKKAYVEFMRKEAAGAPKYALGNFGQAPASGETPSPSGSDVANQNVPLKGGNRSRNEPTRSETMASRGVSLGEAGFSDPAYKNAVNNPAPASYYKRSGGGAVSGGGSNSAIGSKMQVARTPAQEIEQAALRAPTTAPAQIAARPRTPAQARAYDLARGQQAGQAQGMIPPRPQDPRYALRAVRDQVSGVAAHRYREMMAMNAQAMQRRLAAARGTGKQVTGVSRANVA